MSDPINQDTPPPADNAPAPVVAARPEYIPETIWDSEKSAPKIDLAASLAERDALKTAADERAAKIPATPDAYSFDLPKDFALPGGYKWEADPKDPLVVAVKAFAVENKLTQDEVGGLVRMYAASEAQKIQSQQAFVAEQTKALGEKAGDRRAAVTTFIDSMFAKGDPKGDMLKTMVDFAPGVEALEAIIAKSNGIKLPGNPGGGDPPNQNAELADKIGKVPMGKALLDLGNSQAK